MDDRWFGLGDRGRYPVSIFGVKIYGELHMAVLESDFTETRQFAQCYDRIGDFSRD